MHEHDLDILKMYQNAKTEVFRSRLSKVGAGTRQTHTQMWPNILPRTTFTGGSKQQWTQFLSHPKY